MDRQTVQNRAVNLSLNNDKVLCEVGTGIGKTLIAIRIIELHGGFWNIVIAERTHELNWVNEFKKHNKEVLLQNVRFFCYQSFHKYIDQENYVFDETHRLLNTDLRLGLLKESTKTLKKAIFLSATVTRTQKESLQSIIGNYQTLKFNLSDAIDFNILPEPKVYFIGIEMNNTNKKYKFHFNKDKYVMCTEREYYNRLSDRVDYFKQKYFESQNHFDKIKWLRSANERKKFMAEIKTPYAKIVLHKLRDKRLICFAANIEQSKQLGAKYAINSKLSKEVQNKLLEDFNTLKIDKLHAVGMLREGINLNKIEAGLIVQLDNQQKFFSQILGRSMRSITPLQYVLYIKDSQDVRYTETALEDFNMDYVKFITISNLK